MPDAAGTSPSAPENIPAGQSSTHAWHRAQVFSSMEIRGIYILAPVTASLKAATVFA